jgi:hypothetical protein
MTAAVHPDVDLDRAEGTRSPPRLRLELDLGLDHAVEVASHPEQPLLSVRTDPSRQLLGPVVNHDLHVRMIPTSPSSQASQ